MDRIDSLSLNLEKNNIDKIKELFPEAVEEGKINFDILRAMLGDEVDDSKEKYQFTWNGKAKSIKLAQTPSSATLRPCKEKSKNWDTTENLYIEGDNLEVLKQLQKTYYGKIKMIYIDPPYNTGKDFVYKDNFVDNIENYKKISNQHVSSNPETSGRYHTDWLNMMYPRLVLSKNLLHQEGMIFISIDENEYSNLKKICDEIYGEENHQATFHIQVRYGDKSLNEEKIFKPMIEYILVYSKNKKEFVINQPTEKYGLEKFVFEIDEIGEGEFFEVGDQKVEVFKKNNWTIRKNSTGSLTNLKETWISGSVYTNMSYGQVFQKVVEPRVKQDGLGCLYKVYGRGEDGLGYRYYTGPAKEGSTRGKMYSGIPLQRAQDILSGEGSIRKKPIKCFYDFSADFGNIRHEGGVTFNSGKKPVKLLKQLINYCVDKEAIVLDFFSGSASTAHAVMQLNLEDRSNRKFIMVQLPEKIDEKSDTYKAGFENICELGIQRIKNAGNAIDKEQNSIDLFSIDNKPIDTGFRVFKLDSTNINYWDNENILDETALFDYEDVFKEDRSKEDVLYEIMLKYGIFDKQVNEIEINGKTMYRVGKRYMIVCLEDEISSEDINAIAKLSPKTVVFKESGFKDDNDKINAEYNLTKSGIEDVKCI